MSDSIRQINEDLNVLAQPNYYDGMKLNVDDLEQLQIYLNKKIEDAVKYIAFDGLTAIEGLEVNPDSAMSLPFPFPTIPQSDSNPDLQNYRDFPEDILDTQDVRMYQVFKAEADNIQRLDLKLQLIEGTGASVLLVELRPLTVPSNPLSEMSNDALFVKQFGTDEIPTLSSDGLLSVDLSALSDGQGILLTTGSYYAVLIRFIRETNCQDQLRVYHSNTAQMAALDSDLGAHFLVNGNFQQGLYNEDAQLVQMVLWHEAFTSAVRVEPGVAYMYGERIIVEEAQRFLSLKDKRNSTDIVEYPNYVAIKFVLDTTDPEAHPRTQNIVDANYIDSFEVHVFDQNEWDVEVAKTPREYFLLAVIYDRNIIPFYEIQEFNLDRHTNLAYKDWLNPCITTPSLPALQIKASRPDDFVFYVDNVPGEFPVTDDSGNQEYDSLGQALTDTLKRMFLILYLDGGTNIRRFEMALRGSTSTTPPFNSYYITLTDPDGNLIPGLANYPYDLNELTPNTFYNFVGLTTRGRSIFIQDFNRQIRTPNPSTGIMSLTRERMFETRLNLGDLTVIINEDLKLGEPIIAYGNVGQRVIGSEAVRQIDEVPGRNGQIASRTINPITDTLLEASDFKFEPLPMCFEDGTPFTIGNPAQLAVEVPLAAAADDIIIKVDGVSVSFSGTEGSERGGTGAPHTVSGQVKFSDDAVERLAQMQALAISLGLAPPADANDYAHFVGLKVTVRDSTGRDNSQQGITSVTQIDAFGDLVYRIIAMGRGAGNPAGFSTGESGNIYFENRLARDSVGVPLTFTYTPFGSSTRDIRQIDSQEQWFGERTIVYAPDLATFRARATAATEVGIDPAVGQVFWNVHDEDLIFTQLALVSTIEYFQLDEKYEVINFYYTRLSPWGTSAKCAILNTDVSIQQAITAQDIILRVNGSALLNGDPNFLDTPSNFLAMPPVIADGTKSCSITSSGVTATVTLLGHGWFTGDLVTIQGVDPTDPLDGYYNGSFLITRVDANTFTYTMLAVPATSPAPGAPKASKILDQSLLAPDKISINPETGRIVFGVNIAPIPADVVTITYYYLKPVTTCASNAYDVAYDARYDFNADGRVDEIDLNLFLAAYGSSVGDPNYDTIYDFNNDGKVDGTDWAEFLIYFGTIQGGTYLATPTTEVRLNSLLVYNKENPLRQLRVVQAVSMAPSITYPFGRSILFLSSDTPVLETGDYITLFGYAAALATGINSLVITTDQSISQVTRDRIDMHNVDDETDIREIIDVLSVSRILNGVTVYDNTLTFTPSIIETATYVIRSLWGTDGLAIINRNQLISTVDREERCRRVFGPFKMTFEAGDFHSDGTMIRIKLDPSEATWADGTSDATGLHIAGEAIYSMRFAVLLFVNTGDNVIEVWRWNHLQPTEADEGIVLSFNEFLALDSRYRGKKGVPVLQPFGMAENQVDLRPRYAGGDVENNLLNIVVIRDDFISQYAPIHNHSGDTEGGEITSENITFEDPESRFESGSVTDIVYQLQDELQTTINGIVAQLANMQLNATQVIFNDTRGCFGSPSGSLTVADALNKLLDFIAWDELNSCP